MATGTEARSLRTWFGRAVAPSLLRWLIVLVLAVLLAGVWVVLAYNQVFDPYVGSGRY
ncbi:MAG: hypothetical protein WD379_03715 [Dehalococcoidia bacterium]